MSLLQGGPKKEGRQPQQRKPLGTSQQQPASSAASRPPDPVATPAPTLPALRNAKYNPPGAGLSYGDGFRFGVGFGLAMAVALPIILGVIYCVASLFIGSAIGALLN